MILNRTYSFVLDILKLEQSVKELRAASNAGARDGTATEELARKDKQIAAIKAQAEGLSKEYSELCDRYERLEKQGQTEALKKDL